MIFSVLSYPQTLFHIGNILTHGGDDVRVDAAVNGLRLTGIEYDARTLRVVAEANGAVNVAVTQLPR